MWYLLALSLLALLFCRPAALLLLLLTLGLAWWQQVIAWPALLALALLALLVLLRKAYGHQRWLLLLSEGVMVIAAAALMLHLIPGFSNQKIISGVQAGPLSVPFTFYYNLDKALIPFVLLGCLPTLLHTTPRSPRHRLAWPLLWLSVPGLLLLATLAGGLAIEPHFPAWIGAFMLANLFFVSLAEEALFRGWLQQRLTHWLGPWPALLLASLAFGLAHLAGGPLLMLFAALAGVVYGLAWQWSGRLWVATLCHFAFNLTHLLLFTYPMLRH